MTQRYKEAVKSCFDKIYENLNPEQRRAVMTVSGPLLVIAGAGSGKTTVLVNRISNIVRYGTMSEYAEPGLGGSDDDAIVLENTLKNNPERLEQVMSAYAVEPCPPYALMCITFTNKAANEMKSRLEKTLGAESARDIWAGTFHNICMRILRKFHDRAGLENGFTIYDMGDAKRLITNILKDLNVDEHVLTPKRAMSIISRAKENLVDSVSFAIINKNDNNLSRVAGVYSEYQRRMAMASAVDFDDIIMRTVSLLQNDEEVRTFIQRRFKYVCVDEYQDTNKAQFVLTSLIAGERRNIMVVGDDDQSIYKFRGATIENILNFDKTYNDAKIIKLERNYRSTAKILDCANAVIKNNRRRRDKCLWTEKKEGKDVIIRQCANQNTEAEYIANTILEGVKNGRSFSDYAVLYRMNAQSSSLENVLTRSGISYRVLGGTRFYDRREVKDIMAYLCLIANLGDNLRLKRIINIPKRKIGDTTINAVETIATAEGCSMFDVCLNSVNYVALSRSAPLLTAFAKLILSFRDFIEEGCLVSELISKVIDDSGYRTMLEGMGFEGEDDLHNIEEIVSNAVEYEKDNEEASLYGFLEDVALIADIDNYDEDADAVVMMTIHSAKGLEFPCVFLPGVEEGIFPSLQSSFDEGEIEEERRLCYVAITRAKEELYCTYAKERLIFGKTQYHTISRFLEEIPEKMCQHIMISKPKPVYDTQYKKHIQTKATANFMKMTENNSSQKKATFTKLNAGDEVKHPTFGHGVILSVRDTGSDVMYEIAFDKVGTKKMMATYAKLEKI